MALILRPGRPEDATLCGTICYEAFKGIAEAHRFPPGYASVQVAIDRMQERLAHPGFYSVVAEFEERVVGSNFLDERGAIAGLGPITVDPGVQNRTLGRQLMQHVLDRVAARQGPGVRLVQAAYHTRSLCLYAKLGFEVRDMLARMTGAPLALDIPAHTVRPARPDDLAACNGVCERVHGHHRGGELADAIQQQTATVVEHAGRLCGYATVIGVSGHAVGETTEAIQALIAAAPAFERGGFLVPLRNGELFRWCLAHSLRAAVPQTLMSCGFYQEPTGAYLPSVLY